MSGADACLTLREARARHFARSGLPPDGGYDARWIRITRGRIPLYLMNTAPRRRAAPLHDLHHCLTGYDTSSAGEAEVGAWELGAGTGPHWIAVVLDLAAVAVGLALAPRRTFRAFVRGRRCRSLYAEPLDAALLGARVDETRARLGLDAPAPAPTAADRAAFAGLAVFGLATLVGFIVLAPILIAVGPLLR